MIFLGATALYLNFDKLIAAPILSWTKPNNNWLKCNVVLSSLPMTALVLAFASETVMVNLSKPTHCFAIITTTPECEATAIYVALQLAMDNGYSCVNFESDCQVAVNAILGNGIYENELGTLVSQCRSLLSTNASFIDRQANSVTHSLARASISHASPNYNKMLG
ncbi:hypothetical protein L195_g033412 [Trifolium pratense]|uniref:RNase H type-1 domain-containing protein n=1 Tax=Trifolium pratense TaxID=57577 RepID=A0A2K3LFZ8_TRIPR|nr:hypothetical protein L195_g033412 [Trifolium pratense]